MKNTPSIITKTPAALLPEAEEPPSPPHQHTQTQGPQNIPSLSIATTQQHTLSWRSGDQGYVGVLGELDLGLIHRIVSANTSTLRRDKVINLILHGLLYSSPMI